MVFVLIVAALFISSISALSNLGKESFSTSFNLDKLIFVNVKFGTNLNTEIGKNFMYSLDKDYSAEFNLEEQIKNSLN